MPNLSQLRLVAIMLAIAGSTLQSDAKAALSTPESEIFEFYMGTGVPTRMPCIPTAAPFCEGNAPLWCRRPKMIDCRLGGFGDGPPVPAQWGISCVVRCH